ncbi:MAG TPA: hypothetical protein VGM11_14720 [Acidobacteriaceae bacterium]
MRKQLLTAAFAAVLGVATAAGAQVYVRVGPPPPRHEVVPPPPHDGWVWRQGYHRWDGHAYVWVPGEYAAPPRPHARWVPGHWRDTPHGYVWVEGHWR